MTKSIWEKIDEINKLDGKEDKGARYSFPFRFLSRYIFERIAYFSSSNRLRVGCYKNMGVNIGEGVYIGNYVIFDRIFPGKVTIGNHTSIGDRCVITAHGNIPSETPLKHLYPRTVKETKVGKGIWIMPNCVVAPGVSIGDYSVIATGAIITKDIPSMVMAGGIPAKPLKDLADQLRPHLHTDEYNKLIKERIKMGYKS